MLNAYLQLEVSAFQHAKGQDCIRGSVGLSHHKTANHFQEHNITFLYCIHFFALVVCSMTLNDLQNLRFGSWNTLNLWATLLGTRTWKTNSVQVLFKE